MPSDSKVSVVMFKKKKKEKKTNNQPNKKSEPGIKAEWYWLKSWAETCDAIQQKAVGW